MAEEVKKISFGFSKLVKKSSVIPAASTKPKETVEFIKCVEDNSIKVFNEVKEETKVLIIPMKPSISIKDLKPQKKSSSAENHSNEETPKTLDELAAKEIVEELKKPKEEEDEQKVFAVPLVTHPPTGEKESTIEDYDNIPVEQYGLAMLRGMGWEPGKGIGKNAKIAPPVAQVVRPKGMGLGADKTMQSSKPVDNDVKDLKLCKNSFVRVISGSNKDSYGTVEGFIEETGRVIVKLARGDNTITVGEFMLQVVTSAEYSKNSKVLNISKYEQYKSNEESCPSKNVSGDSDSNSEEYSRKQNSSSKHSADTNNSRYSNHRNGNSRHEERRDHKSDSSRYRDREDSDRHRNREDSCRHRDRDDSSRYRDRDDSSRHRDRDDSSRHRDRDDSYRHKDREHSRQCEKPRKDYSDSYEKQKYSESKSHKSKKHKRDRSQRDRRSSS